jgi:hypothetical protein
MADIERIELRLKLSDLRVLMSVVEDGSMRARLQQNYPNPFNPKTTIGYELPRTTHVTLKVYDVFGREITTLVDGVEDAGVKSIAWDAATAASGIYFYKLQAGEFVGVKKLIVLK